MKHSFCAVAAIAGLLFAQPLLAQDRVDTAVRESVEVHTEGYTKKHKLMINANGVAFETTKTEHPYNDSLKWGGSKFKMGYMLMDLGLSVMIDNTNYAQSGVRNLLNVPANQQNKSLFDMRTGKSVDVNIYPWLIKFKAMRTRNMRIYISSGIGLQLYNFRYEDPITFTRNPVGVQLDTISFKKNKLATDYLNVPLMFTLKSRISRNQWLVYGAGLTGGVLIDSWTKQKSEQRGKVKVHDQFGLAQFNTCLSAEVGIEGSFRLFATYQLTSLFQNGLDQHPFTIGFRFGGI